MGIEIFERVRALRKNHLKLSQEKFGAALGVNRDVINNIELNRLVKPEQKEPLYKLICKTFNVNYEWLTTGQGEMYVQTKASFVEKLAAEYGLSFTAQKIVECYLNLDDEQRATVDGFIMSVAESLVEPPIEVEETGAVDEAIDKTIEIYRAAISETHTEHEVIPDGQNTLEKLRQAKPGKVTSKDEF